MKTQQVFFKTAMPFLLVAILAIEAKAQAPEKQKEIKKEDYRIKIVKEINGKKTVFDTSFSSKEALLEYNQKNIPIQLPASILKIEVNKESLKNIESSINGDTTFINATEVNVYDGADIEKMFLNDTNNVLKKMLNDEFGNVDMISQVKVVKIVRKIVIEDVRPEELAESSNAEIKNAAKQKPLVAKNVSVYPSPSNGGVMVTFDAESTGEATILVSDLQGRSVHEEKFFINNTGAVQRSLDINGQADGVYLLKVTLNNTSIVKKIILSQAGQ